MKSANKKKKRRYTVKTKSRMAVIFLCFGLIISGLGYRLVSSLYQIQMIREEKSQLEGDLISLSDEKKKLEADIERLSEPDYIAKYVREKYFYSKDGELIIRIEE